jgi:hypothetical protein
VSPSGYGPGFVLVLITYPDSTLLRAELYFAMSTTWLPKVPVLTQENYNLWKVEMKMLLIREKLWAVVSGRDEKPSTEGSAASTKKALVEWEEKAERAYATIFPFLEPSAKTLLGEELDPVELWSKLKKMYEIQGFSASFMVWKRLLGARASDDIRAYVSGIQENAQILRAAGHTLDNELITAVLLAGLPPEYGSFITLVTQSLRTNSVDIDALVSQILDEAMRVGDSGIEAGTRNVALVSTKLECWVCHETGHKAATCRKKGKIGRYCGFCDMRDSHTEETCWKKYPEKTDMKEKPTEQRSYFSISGAL